MRILVSGGAGFVGSHLAVKFRQEFPNATIVALDNLKRRGSELNLAKFKTHNIEFAHGDVRQMSDLNDLGKKFDIFVEASAEPSVLAGLGGSPNYLLDTNLTGTLNCLEFARQNCGMFIFLSTSRVYSIDALRSVPLITGASRFELDQSKKLPGLTTNGITEEFSTSTARSLYGATKLASEMLTQEYHFTYGLPSVINRCGVLCGPGQFGKVDQGVFTLWVANHYFGKPLKYVGYEGSGKQVRDLLHPDDLYSLIRKQMDNIKVSAGQTYNAGGGNKVSTSLLELTRMCQEITGKQVSIDKNPETTRVDIPWYVTDSSFAKKTFGWEPKIGMNEILTEIATWLRNNESMLKPIFS